MLVRQFKEELLNSILEILWRQWSSFGIYSNVESEDKFLVDPESLICATCFFGRFEQRLFDEVIHWLSENGDLINTDRLKNVLRFFDTSITRISGAIGEYLVQKEQKKKWERIVRFCEKTVEEREIQNLFFSKDLSIIPIMGEIEDSFQKWGFKRNKIDTRRQLQKINFDKQSNLILKIRLFFGVNARADVCTFLLFSEGENSLQISQKVHFNQRNVYHVLKELSRSGLVAQKFIGKRVLYSINHDSWFKFFQVETKISYIIWSKIFSALSYLFIEFFKKNETFKDTYLASSELRRISEKFIPLIDSANLKAFSNNIENYVGELYGERFIDYVKEVLRQIN